MTINAMNFFNQNVIKQVIDLTDQLPNNPFIIDSSQSPDQMAQEICSNLDAFSKVNNKFNTGIHPQLLVAGVIAYIGTRPFDVPDPRPVLLVLLGSSSQPIRSSALLIMLASGVTNINFNIEDLQWSIESALLFVYPIDLFIKILTGLRKIIHKYPSMLDVMLKMHSEFPYNRGGSENSADKVSEMSLFLVEKGRADRNILDELMHLHEGLGLSPEETTYLNRARKLLANKFETASPIRDLMIQKIIQDCQTDSFDPNRLEGYMKMLMQVDPNKCDPGTLQNLIAIVREGNKGRVHPVTSMIKMIYSFSRGGGPESLEAKKWVGEEISNQSVKDADLDYAFYVLYELVDTIKRDSEIEIAIQALQKKAKNPLIRKYAEKVLAKAQDN